MGIRRFRLSYATVHQERLRLPHSNGSSQEDDAHYHIRLIFLFEAFGHNGHAQVGVHYGVEVGVLQYLAASYNGAM